jgi:hypothetical protein
LFKEARYFGHRYTSCAIEVYYKGAMTNMNRVALIIALLMAGIFFSNYPKTIDVVLCSKDKKVTYIQDTRYFDPNKVKGTCRVIEGVDRDKYNNAIRSVLGEQKSR